MFIAHGDKFRKNARWIMAGILILLIPGFVALFTTTGGGGKRSTQLPKMNGKEVDAAEFERARNDVGDEHVIRAGRSLPHSAAVEDSLKQQAVVRMLMVRKAKEMGLGVSQQELERHIVTQPVFINEAQQFDANRYQQFLISRRQLGITEARFWEVMRGQLLMEKLRAIVGTTAKATPAEVNLAYAALHERTTIEAVEVHVNDWKDPISLSDADAQAYFDKNKEKFRLPKRVKVRYVLFSIAAAEKNLKMTDEDVAQHYEKNRVKFEDSDGNVKPLDAVKADVCKDLIIVRADRAAGDHAMDFSARVAQEENGVKPDFTKSATAAGLTVQETAFFGPTDDVSGIKDSQAFRRMAFSLSATSPCSDPVQSEEGYYVLQLAGNKPSEIPPFETVKDDVRARLKQERIYEAVVKRGQEWLVAVKQAVSAGKSFDVACQTLHLSTKTYGPFSMADEQFEMPASGRVREIALGLAKGSISDFIKTGDGGLFFYLKNRLPPDPNADSLQKEQLARTILEQNRQAIFQSWVNALVQQEKVDFGVQRSQAVLPPTDTEESESEPVKGS